MSDPKFNENNQAWRDAIARKEDELRMLEIKRDTAKRELQSIKAAFKSSTDSNPEPLRLSGDSNSLADLTNVQKINLFRSLFRGRDDIFSTLWSNEKTGRTGYALRCSNEWKPGICSKPRVRCGECPNQEFLPVTDRVILDHLRGRHVVGVFPMLKDETCWFLAVDFDKGDWMREVAAFRDVCNSAELPVSVERSRSGDGAHAWFFFDMPVRASLARRMGCHLITQTMSRCHSLSLSSYDRLFPNQDNMPRGGFGNLIALPLQREPRWRDNTVFIDECFNPFPDQWAYLTSVERIPASSVERIAQSAVLSGQVLGVRSSETEEEDIAEPWLFPPSYQMRHPVLPVGENIPNRVKSNLAQRLYINKDGLTSPVLNALIRLAAFQNPEFYKKQNLRLSTALTPRIISCAEEHPQFVALPRGCVEDAVGLFERLGTVLKIEDHRQVGEIIKYRFQGTLTELQKNAVRSMLDHDIGILIAPPGIGKTVAGIKLIAERARNTLVLVHRQPLLEQWIAQLGMFLNLETKFIGRIGGGKRHVTGQIDVAMIQSLVRKGQVADLVADYGHVVVDECHHISAVSFEKVLTEVKAKYITGLTATSKRRDGQHPIFEMQLGPIRYIAERKLATTLLPFTRRLIVRETAFELVNDDANQTIQHIYRALAADKQRNDLIIDDIVGSLEAGRSPIVLTERKDHLDYLSDRLRGFVKHLIVLKGGVSTKKRRENLAALKAIPEGEERLILATGRYIGEGFDDARLDTLFLTMPVSWRGTIVQYTGRLNRSHPRKTEVQIYDYVDQRVQVLARMYKRRLTGYRSIGCQIKDETFL